MIPTLLLLAVACHRPEPDDSAETEDTVDTDPPASLLELLRAIPEVPSARALQDDDWRYSAYDIRFRQPADHGDPEAGSFEQQITLVVNDRHSPTVLYSTGYWNYWGQHLSEPAELLRGNQLVVEHRYFGTSIPADPDWSLLTIEQAAADHHAIITALRPILDGPWITSGASKGGMTSVYHRRFWPDDVDGTVAYVAPISFGAPDTTWGPFLDTLGTEACRDALRAVEEELLVRRRGTLEALAAAEATNDGIAYTRIAIGPAVEAAVLSIYWAFWQYAGVASCAAIPPVTASDATMWQFLQATSAVSGSSDASLAGFDAYYYQAEAELGFPAQGDEGLADHLLYGDDDYAGLLPVSEPPAFDPTAMVDVDAWVQSEGDRLLFVYGQWDPWTGGAFELGGATDSAKLFVAQGNHGAGLGDLGGADRDLAFSMLEAWTGVAPRRSGARSRPPELRVPPAFLRLHRAPASR